MGIGAISISCGAVNGATSKGRLSLFGGMANSKKMALHVRQHIRASID